MNPARSERLTTLQRENMADAQHAIWASWMEYLFSVSQQNNDGSVTIPSDKVQRWSRQMITPYRYLSDGEKDSDREQADKVLIAIAKVSTRHAWSLSKIGVSDDETVLVNVGIATRNPPQIDPDSLLSRSGVTAAVEWHEWDK